MTKMWKIADERYPFQIRMTKQYSVGEGQYATLGYAIERAKKLLVGGRYEEWFGEVVDRRTGVSIWNSADGVIGWCREVEDLQVKA